MSSILVVSSRGNRISIQRKTLSQRIHVGVVTLSVALILIIATVLVAYLLTSNINATKGYQIKNLNQERERLQRTNQQLNLSISDSSSLVSVSSSQKMPAIAAMVNPSSEVIAFANAVPEEVAKR